MPSRERYARGRISGICMCYQAGETDGSQARRLEGMERLRAHIIWAAGPASRLASEPYVVEQVREAVEIETSKAVIGGVGDLTKGVELTYNNTI